ncbi:MAG: hypothetical protein EXX96DRAFT_577559 [Benjaminiella poitrasii]|nr:MAG: hypothetical protein EXX96DRAFT_577559 [Benjaminiella poitrasii]
MPINKSNFQPKDARAVTLTYSDDEDDDDMSEFFQNEKPTHGRRMMTGTQALVEFLKTTSPEEFQRNAPERSVNTIFSRIRKPKRTTAPPPPPPSIIPTSSISSRSVPSSSASLPGTLTSATTLTATNSFHGNKDFVRRKNYIEIVPQQQKLISRSAGNSRSPSFDTTSIQSFVLRNSSTNINNNNSKSNEPILPNKKRESSLYSGSLRYSASVRSQLSTATNNNNRRPLIREVNSQNSDLKVTEEYLTLADGMDDIESALLQRLERIRLLNEEIPSDQVAAGLATEHVRALGITHILDNQHLQECSKTKTRHMQVQTEETIKSYINTLSDEVEKHKPQPQITLNEEDPELRAKRAEAALEDALDHFEVISGLAYKKLRELWEEKMRWENACMELRDRLLAIEQKKYPTQQQQQQQRNEYCLAENVEEEDELGLSEFPCNEN